MGQNRYGTWDDAKMEANERRYQKRMRAADEKFVNRYNAALEKLRKMERDHRAWVDEQRRLFREEQDRLVTPHAETQCEPTCRPERDASGT